MHFDRIGLRRRLRGDAPSRRDVGFVFPFSKKGPGGNDVAKDDIRVSGSSGTLDLELGL